MALSDVISGVLKSRIENPAVSFRAALELGSLAIVTPTGTPTGTKFLRDDFSWQTPAGGGGTVDTANSPAASEFARFTDADTIEGRTAAETRADLDLEAGTDFPSLATFNAHASRHHSGSADPIKLDDLAAPDDNTDLNASATAHGLLPKWPNNTTTFFRGDGTYATPPNTLGSDGDKGDVTVGGTGTTLTVDGDAITFAKMQNIATDRLIGRDTAASGDPEEISVGGGLEFTGAAGIQRSALTGDVTASAGSGATSIANNAVTDAKLRDSAAVSVVGRSANSAGDPSDIAAGANDRILRRVSDALDFGQLTIGMIPDDLVTYAKLQNVSATSRLLGRITAGAGDTEELTGSQATTLLDVFTSGAKGLVPASGGGTTNFLRADGTFAAPSGGSGADPPEGSYAPGSYTVATGKFRVAARRQEFTTTQRLTIQGTGRLSLYN